MITMSQAIRNYIKEKGFQFSTIAKRTNIPYVFLCTSFSDNNPRQLRADELMALCVYLEIDPMKIYRKIKEAS